MARSWVTGHKSQSLQLSRFLLPYTTYVYFNEFVLLYVRIYISTRTREYYGVYVTPFVQLLCALRAPLFSPRHENPRDDDFTPGSVARTEGKYKHCIYVRLARHPYSIFGLWTWKQNYISCVYVANGCNS